MKLSYLIGFTLMVTLSGCSSWDHYRGNKGYRDGKKYCALGIEGDSVYYQQFYRAFVIQNLKIKDFKVYK